MLKYVNGDATVPQGIQSLSVIAHLCNNKGKWGAGFTGALSARWPQPEMEYRRWFADGVHQGFRGGQTRFELGQIQIVPVYAMRGGAPCIVVANMIAQNGINKKGQNKCRVDYDALATALGEVREYLAWKDDGSVHMPRIGTGLACGDWSAIEPLIRLQLVEFGIDVTVYNG